MRLAFSAFPLIIYADTRVLGLTPHSAFVTKGRAGTASIQHLQASQFKPSGLLQAQLQRNQKSSLHYENDPPEITLGVDNARTIVEKGGSKVVEPLNQGLKPQKEKGMRVTINGGGIGGMATALALHAMNIPNIDIVIIEKSMDNFMSRENGLILQPHAVKALNDMGLMEEVVANGWAPWIQQYYTADGRLIAESPRGLRANPTGYPQISIHQLELYSILEQAVETRLGKGAIIRDIYGTEYTEDQNGPSLSCMDASGNEIKIDSDVVIDAGDVHSEIQQAIQEKKGGENDPTSSGMVTYQGTSIVDKVLDGHTVVLAGTSRAKLVCYPLEAPVTIKEEDGSYKQKQLLNWVVEIDDKLPTMDLPQEVLVEHIINSMDSRNDGFDLPFLDFAGMLYGADGIQAFSVPGQDLLRTWCDGRVAMVGDEAYPMYPVESNGASTALLNAVDLATSFASAARNSNDNLDGSGVLRALHLYGEARRALESSKELAYEEVTPEQIMDLVHSEVPKACRVIPSKYNEKLLEALTKCEANETPHQEEEISSNEEMEGEVKKTNLVTRLLWPNRELMDNFTPLERLLLGSDGTLQQSMSLLAHSDVNVKPVMTTARHMGISPIPALDRFVSLHLGLGGGPLICNCTTTVVSDDKVITEKMLSNEVGIGQLMRERKKAGEGPSLKLISCGKKHSKNVLTRQYALCISKVTFLIYEEMFLSKLFGSRDDE